MDAVMGVDILEEAMEIANKYSARELFDAELVNITPALVGSWRATRYANEDKCLVEPPRPTDIAGKTRWWLRAILAAGLYEARGIHAPIYFLNDLASAIMGNAGDRESGSLASRVIIVVEPLKEYRALRVCLDMPCSWLGDPRARQGIIRELAKGQLSQRSCSPEEPEECCKLALLSSRILLATLGRTGKDVGRIPLPPGFYRFRLRVYERPGTRLSDAEEGLLGTALGLAVFVTGIGRMVTRGYGKLGLGEYTGASDARSVLEEHFMKVYDMLLHRHEPMKAIAEAVLDTSRDYVEALLRREMTKYISKYRSEEPLAATLHPKYIVEMKKAYVPHV